jgi:phosphatidylserine/phosphatidylglycerophosphate/cardiolipin synthase-like enzyme
MTNETKAKTTAVEQPAVKPEDYLLESEDEDDYYEFLAPIREKVLVEPLVDGSDTFKAMEDSIVVAQECVYLTIWYFQPSMKLQSPSARSLVLPPLPGKKREQPLRTWMDLLCYVVRVKGAEVRIILTDFDPVFSLHHRHAWQAYRMLCELVTTKIEAGKRRQFQVICSLHTATTGFLEDRMKEKLNTTIKRLNQNRRKVKKLLNNRPGLWKYIRYNPKTKKYELNTDQDFDVHVASHHQKTCIVDESVAFCGGLDVQFARLDNKEHKNQNKMPWHDVHCRLNGAPVGDLKRNFIGRWNAEIERFQDFVESANNDRPRGPSSLPIISVTPLKESVSSITTTPGEASVQVLRTLTEEGKLPTPSILRDDIEKVYKKALQQATKYVYIENQYLRALEIAEWLLDRRKDKPDLQVIIVLPVAPEEARARVLDEATRHGLALQYEVLKRLQDGFKGNLGIYSMVQRAPAPKPLLTNHLNSRMIYVHSKVLIVDDVFCVIGSANANLRSFRVDTELAIGWFDEPGVKRFRKNLWQELLGSPKTMETWKPENYVKEWDEIAKKNQKLRPRRRRGFVVFHTMEFERKGEKIRDFPEGEFADEFAELDLEPEQIQEAVV